jgi:hypothetical protein
MSRRLVAIGCRFAQANVGTLMLENRNASGRIRGFVGSGGSGNRFDCRIVADSLNENGSQLAIHLGIGQQDTPSSRLRQQLGIGRSRAAGAVSAMRRTTSRNMAVFHDEQRAILPKD